MPSKLPPIPPRASVPAKPKEVEEPVEFFDADLAEVPSQGPALLRFLAAGVFVTLLVALIVALTSGGDGEEAAAAVGPEDRLMRHLGGGTPPAPGRFEVVRAGDAGMPVVALYTVRDTRVPNSVVRACAVMAEAVLCPSSPPEWRTVLDALGLPSSDNPPDEASWITAAAWMLGVDPEAVYRGEAPASSTPTTVVLAISAALPGLDASIVAEAAGAAFDHLGAGSGLLVLSEGSQGWLPIAGIEDAGDWAAATAELANLSWPSTEVVLVPANVPAGRRLHVLAIQGADVVDPPSLADLVPALDVALSDVTYSGVSVGGPSPEGLVRAAFAGNGRVYTLAGAAALPDAVAQEVARVSGRQSPLEPPRVGRIGEGTVAVRFFAEADGGWQRHALQVASDGQSQPVVGAVWQDATRPQADASTPVPDLVGGDWLDGALSSADPTGQSGLPIDRLRLTLDDGGRFRFELEAASFRPRLTVLAAGTGQPVGSERGESEVRLDLDLDPGHYVVAIQAADPSNGTYRVRATRSGRSGEERDDSASARREERRSERRSGGRTERRSGREEAASTDTAPTTESLSDDMLRRTMRRVIPDMTECADGYRGAVYMDITVERGGSVARVNVEGDGLPTAAADCLRELVEGVEFEGYSGPPVNARYAAAF